MVTDNIKRAVTDRDLFRIRSYLTASTISDKGLTGNFKDCFEYCVKNIFPKCEFIPISISENDGCVLSHKGYMDRIFGYQQEITSPCLGKNIKKHEEYMKGLSSWIEKGGYIKDNMFYLITEDRKSIEHHTYYLRPWKVD